MAEPLIAVTAVGAVIPGGTGAAALRLAVETGAPVAPAAPRGPGVAAATIGEGLKGLVRRKGLAALSRGALLAAAAIEDLLAARQDVLGGDGRRGDVALIVGTAFGHVESKADFHATALRDGVRLVSPIVFPNTIINSLGGHAAILFGLTGPNSTITSGRRSGLEAILRAMTLLRAGRACSAIVACADEASPSLLRAMAGRMQAQAAGIDASEAGVALLLEPVEAARSAGKGWIVAGGGERNTGRARDPGACLEQAAADALASAGLDPTAVGLVVTSAAGDSEQEAVQSSVLRYYLDRGARELGLGRVYGETWGTTGALAVGTILALQAGAGLSALAGPGPLSLVTAVDPGGATCLVLRPTDL